MDRLTSKIECFLLAWFNRSRSGPVPFVRQFLHKDIRKATDCFHRIMYSGFHGVAYRARFQNGEVALVKEVRAFGQDKETFYQEVELLGCLHHRHILALRGFSTGHRRLLVFDNIENGSLKEHLNDPLKTPLNWKTRVQIAIGVVAALEYLSFFCNPPTYHVSIKSSNIMLDENFTAKVTDVSLYRSTEGNHETLSLCPKECSNMIFQLGVLILELVTGQTSEQEGPNLMEWVQESCFGSSIHKMIDPDLGNNYSSSELRRLLAVARLCIKSRDEPSAFSITHIYRYLQNKIDAP